MAIWGLINWLNGGYILAVDEEDVTVFVSEVLTLIFVVGGVTKEAASDCERTSVEKVRYAL